MRTWWINVAWQTPFNVCSLSRTTQQVWYEATSYTVGRKEHTGPAAQDVNCHSSSLAAGEESSGGYSSWQISKGCQRLFVQFAEPPGEPIGVTGFCLRAQTGVLQKGNGKILTCYWPSKSKNQFTAVSPSQQYIEPGRDGNVFERNLECNKNPQQNQQPKRKSWNRLIIFQRHCGTELFPFFHFYWTRTDQSAKCANTRPKQIVLPLPTQGQ